MIDLINRVQQFVENEARSCSMDFGCITPLYVYRMWGGMVTIDDITKALKIINKQQYNYVSI